MVQILFSGDDIFVGRNNEGGKEDILFITFTALLDNDLRIEKDCWNCYQSGFGEKYFAKQGISAIFFVSKWNHWWHTREIATAVESIKSVVGGYRRVVLYGASMGAYGALLLCNDLNADTVIISAPQIHIDFNQGSFDNRWMHLREKITFLEHDIPAEVERFRGNIHVFFDPDHRKDTKQISYIESPQLIQHPIRYSDHFPLELLSNAKKLDSVLRKIVLGDGIDEEIVLTEMFALHKRMRACLAQKEDADIYRELAILFKNNDPDLAGMLIEKALQHRPHGGLIKSLYTEIHGTLK